MATMTAIPTSCSRADGLAGQGEQDTEASPLTFTEFVQHQRYFSTPRSSLWVFCVGLFSLLRGSEEQPHLRRLLDFLLAPHGGWQPEWSDFAWPVTSHVDVIVADWYLPLVNGASTTVPI